MPAVSFDVARNVATVTVNSDVRPVRVVDLGRALVHVDGQGAVASVVVADARIERSGDLWWWLTEVLRRCRWDGTRPEGHVA